VWRERKALVLAIAAAGFLAAVLPETTPSGPIPGYRHSGLWHVAGLVGVVGGRTSLLMVALSTAGAVIILAWGRALSFRDRWVLRAALAAFMAAQSASPMVWQRYDEPLVLMVCAIMACRIPGAISPRLHVLRVAGPLILGVLLAGLTTAVIATSSPTEDFHLDPRTGREPPGALHPRGRPAQE
jgi:hypothetical protein